MHFLFLYVLCALHFSQLLRLGQKRSCRTMAVVGVNYVLAAALSAGVALWLGAFGAQGRRVLTALGSVNGVLFVLHALIMMAAFRIVGTGITWAFVGSGIVIPVLFSRFAWNEPMSGWQWLALGLVPFAVGLLRPPARREAGARRAGLKGDLILALCFLMAGAIGTIHKAQQVYAEGLPAPEGPPPLFSRERLFYQAVLFGTTLLVSGGYLLARRMRPTWKELKIGTGVGLANTGGLFFALLALSVVEGTVFFPTTGCSVIVGNTVVGRLLWRERMVSRQLVGLALAMAVVVLAHLRA
jgi:drug/metabolite transporter (DMT)-like permease